MTYEQKTLWQDSVQVVSTSTSGALFSACRKYRFALWREWNNDLPKIMFIGLNPSKANEVKPDNTVTRVINFSKKWGYGGVYMMNLFTFVSPYPADLLKIDLNNPTYLANDYMIMYAQKSEKIVCAWGTFKAARVRSVEVLQMFGKTYCLGVNSDGSPKHPLYLKSDCELIEYKK